jgi:chitin synthase
MGYGRERSRSPSPGFDDSVNYDRVADVEKALMAEQEGAQLHQPPVGSQLTQRPPYSADLNGDISLMGGGFTSNDSRDSLYKSPVDDDFETVPLVEGQEGKDTQHFGPAPTQRIGRRGANARRVKQKVTLDDTGMFAVEMPIPTRLATHLPVNCVAEQRSTR